MLGSIPAPEDYNFIHQPDITAFGPTSGIWINGTQPVILEPGDLAKPQLPSNEFPFTRLASIATIDGLTTYLYHQMNGTTFAEEQWDDRLGIWLPTEYINVSDS